MAPGRAAIWPRWIDGNAKSAREHVIFTGKLDPEDLGLAERPLARVVHAPTGDFRDREAIQGWARSISVALRVSAATS